MTQQQRTGFGRRGAPRARDGSRPTSSPASAAGGTQPSNGEQLRGLVLKLLVLVPATVCVVTPLAIIAKSNASSIGESGASSASAASSSSLCRAKATSGSVFDIDWCHVAAAAARGAVTGVAAGAARR